MAKTITLRIDDELYKKFKEHADIENRSLSNFIKTATMKYIDEIDLVDDFEMEEIYENKDLMERLKKGNQDVKKMKGNFV